MTLVCPLQDQKIQEYTNRDCQTIITYIVSIATVHHGRQQHILQLPVHNYDTCESIIEDFQLHLSKKKPKCANWILQFQAIEKEVFTQFQEVSTDRDIASVHRIGSGEQICKCHAVQLVRSCIYIIQCQYFKKLDPRLEPARVYPLSHLEQARAQVYRLPTLRVLVCLLQQFHFPCILHLSYILYITVHIVNLCSSLNRTYGGNIYCGGQDG